MHIKVKRPDTLPNQYKTSFHAVNEEPLFDKEKAAKIL